MLGEEGFEGQQLVECGTQRIDVGAMIDRHAVGQRLLGAHVAERAQQVAGHGERGVRFDVGQAEVGDPDLALAVQHEVGWFDVAVDDPLVGMVEGFGYVPAQIGDRLEKLRDFSDLRVLKVERPASRAGVGCS